MLDGRRRGRIGSEDVRSCLPCVKAADAERRRAAVGREGRRRGRIGREDVELSHGRAAMAIVREVFRRGRIGRDDVLLKNCGDVTFLQLASIRPCLVYYVCAHSLRGLLRELAVHARSCFSSVWLHHKHIFHFVSKSTWQGKISQKGIHTGQKPLQRGGIR